MKRLFLLFLTASIICIYSLPECLGGEITIIEEIAEEALPKMPDSSIEKSAYFGIIAMPLDFSLFEIKTKTWKDKGKTVQLLRSQFFKIKRKSKPNIMVFIYGNIDSGNIFCIDFYGIKLSEIKDESVKLKLLRHNYFTKKASSVVVSVESQKNRLFLSLKTTIMDSLQKRTIQEAYELNDDWQLVKGINTFISPPLSPKKNKANY